jgi:hypothetical protein
MLESHARGPGQLDDVFVETVEEARMYAKVLLSSAAKDFQKFASQSIRSVRSGRVYSGSVAYGERFYHSDTARSVVGQYLLMGIAAMGEVRALQTLGMVRDELKGFFALSTPNSVMEENPCGGFQLNLKNGQLRVSLETSQGESMLAVLS